MRDDDAGARLDGDSDGCFVSEEHASDYYAVLGVRRAAANMLAVTCLDLLNQPADGELERAENRLAAVEKLLAKKHPGKARMLSTEDARELRKAQKTALALRTADQNYRDALAWIGKAPRRNQPETPEEIEPSGLDFDLAVEVILGDAVTADDLAAQIFANPEKVLAAVRRYGADLSSSYGSSAPRDADEDEGEEARSLRSEASQEEEPEEPSRMTMR